MIKAVIFDMDGVVSDTQKLHSRVESSILSRFGINITPEEITLRYSGVRTKEFFKELLTEANADFNLEELMLEKWEKMNELAKISVDYIDGIYELLDLLLNANIKLAVGTASSTKYALSVLNKLNISDKFLSIVTGDMVEKGKPDPAIFLLAAKNIDTDPNECLVIEDGISGMLAAKNANMKCIGLVKTIDYDKYPTINQILSLREMDMDYLKSL